MKSQIEHYDNRNGSCYYDIIFKFRSDKKLDINQYLMIQNKLEIELMKIFNNEHFKPKQHESKL